MLIDIIKKAHNSEIKIDEIEVYGYQFNYKTNLMSSVSKILFKKLDIIEDIIDIDLPNRPGDIKESIDYITVHDTASSKNTAGSVAHSNYLKNGGGGTSWHYSVGDDAVIHQIPNNEVAYHAGDGSRKFELINTHVEHTTDQPVIDFTTDGYYKINNTPTNIRPFVTQNQVESLDLTNYQKSDINDYGLDLRIIDGYYYMNKTYLNKVYNKLCNYGGNYNSIGMETMVNETSNLYKTWMNTAVLCANLCIENNLTTQAVKFHHYFSGKDCPMTLRRNNKVTMFYELLELNYQYIKNSKTCSFIIEENEYVDNLGFIIKKPSENTIIKYSVIIDNTKYDFETKIIV